MGAVGVRTGLGVVIVLVGFMIVCDGRDGLPVKLTFELADNDKMCFYHKYKGAKNYVFDYEVVKGGRFDIDASVTSPNGKILYKETKKMQDSFTFESSFGEYSFCFSNEFSTISHKTIYFSLAEEDLDTLAVEAGNEDPTANTLLEASLEAIHSSGTKVVSYQTEYRLNEVRGRFIAENLTDRIQWWSLGQAIIILLTGFGQVFILKTFFTDKKGPSASLTAEKT